MRVIPMYGHDAPLPDSRTPTPVELSEQKFHEPQEPRRIYTPPTDDESDVTILDEQLEKGTQLDNEESESRPNPNQNLGANDADVIATIPASIVKGKFERTEEQNATRRKQDQNVIPAPVVSSCGEQSFSLENQKLGDYEMQLMMLKQRNKKRLMPARVEQKSRRDLDQNPIVIDTTTVAAPATTNGPQDKNGTKVKQEQDMILAPVTSSLENESPSIGDHRLLDYQAQLVMLEQSSIKRLEQARQEQMARRERNQNPKVSDTASYTAKL